MKHAAWLATLWLAGCCCLRSHPAPPAQPAAIEPPAAAVVEPAVAAPAPAVMTTPEAAVAAVPAPADPPVAPSAAQPPRPPQTEQGQWTIVVVSERAEHDTQAWVHRLGDAGFRVEIQPVKIGDTVWYRVLLPGFRARGEALAALPLANAAAGVNDSFIWRRRPAKDAGN